MDAILLMAGTGSRVGLPYNKLLYRVNNKEIFLYVLEKFLDFNNIYLVVNETDYKMVLDLVSQYSNVKLVIGGKTRSESAYNAALESNSKYLLIHDVARCHVLKSEINQLVNLYNSYDGLAMLASDLKHSILKCDLEYVNRNSYLNALTPQIVPRAKLIFSYEKAVIDNIIFTDDISLVKHYFSLELKIIKTSNDFKLTTKEDLEYLDRKLSSFNFKIGHSFDTHVFEENKSLYLGGVLIDNNIGLKAHSDGDVLLHALSEAIIGALGLGDLGDHFSDKDEKNKGISSVLILQYASNLLKEYNYKINNIDLIIYSEKIKITPYKIKIKESIATILNIKSSLINIKATTMEGKSYIGRSEGLAAEAVVLLKEV